MVLMIAQVLLSVYFAGFLVTAYMLLQSITAAQRSLARQSSQFASGAAIGILGACIVWPLTMLVLFYAKFAIGPEAIDPNTVDAALLADADDDADESHLVQYDGPLITNCAICDDVDVDVTHGSAAIMNVVLPGGDDTVPAIENYTICQRCFRMVVDDYGVTRRQPQRMQPYDVSASDA